MAADGEFAGGLGRAGSRWVALRHQGKAVLSEQDLKESLASNSVVKTGWEVKDDFVCLVRV